MSQKTNFTKLKMPLYFLIVLFFLFANKIQAQTQTSSLKKDLTFFANGCFSIGNEELSGGSFTCIKKQDDSHIIIAGYENDDYVKRNAFLIRIDLNGNVDSTFGKNGSYGFVVNKNEGNEAMSDIKDIAIANDGKIYILGTCYDENTAYNTYLTRITKDGKSDSSFLEGGFILFDYHKRNDIASKIKILPNGSLLIAGYSTSFNAEYSADDDTHPIESGVPFIAKLFANGDSDSSFGNFGELELPITPLYENEKIQSIITSDYNFTTKKFDLNDYQDNLMDMVIQPDGKILITGVCNSILEEDRTSESDDFYLIRLLPNGELDKSFNRTGKIIQDINNEANFSKKIVLLPNGKIWVIGETSCVIENENQSKNDVFIVQYNRNGSVDKSFGDRGVTITPMLAYDMVSDAFLTSDNKVVVQGTIVAKLRELLDAYIIKDAKEIERNNEIKENTSEDELNKNVYNSYTARFLLDGKLDTTMQVGGKIFSRFHDFKFDFKINAFLALDDHNIISVGQEKRDNQHLLLIVKQTITLDIGDLVCTKETNSISIYPNPIRQEANVKYKLCNDEKISLYLYDVQGKLITTFLDNQQKEKGEYEEQLRFDDALPNGIYILVFQTNAGTNSLKIQIVK